MLEDETLVYAVHYLHRGVAARIAVILKRFGGTGALSGRTPRVAARRLAALYADLDHAHGFYEGNSRTLREFTRSLADAAGFTLDWIGTGVGAAERNQLYIARDAAVLERAFPGLTEQRAMETDNRAEYEAWFRLERLRGMLGERTLEAILRERLSRPN
jgi:cell filamentation protein